RFQDRPAAEMEAVPGFVAVPLRGRVDHQHGITVQSGQRGLRLVLVQVEAPAPGSGRDSAAESKEFLPVDLERLAVEYGRGRPGCGGLSEVVDGLVVSRDQNGRRIDAGERADRFL